MTQLTPHRPTVVLGSTILSAVTERLRQDLPDWNVIAVDLGSRAEPPTDLDSVASVLSRADALVPIRGLIDARVLGIASSCRIIQQFGVGLDSVDLDAARARRVPTCNVPSRIGGNAESVAEMALFHLIGAGREYKRLQEMVVTEDYDAPIAASLFGKTVCIVGFGNIGGRLARLLRPFGCTVIGIRRRVDGRVPGPAASQVWPVAELRTALGLADFVVVTLPLSEATAGFIGTDEIQAMRPGARIVNVSRGATIDRVALHDGLASGHVAAAGLDVFWEEPLAASDPVLAQNVTTTPHCAGLTDYMLAGTSRIVAGNIQRVMHGHRARYRVRPMSPSTRALSGATP